MKFNLSFATSVLLLASYSLGLVIYRPSTEPLQKKGLSSLREMKIRAESELKSLMSPKFSSEYYERLDISSEANNNEDQLYILPRNLLTDKIFRKLGLDKLTEDSYNFNLTTYQNSYENILVPKDFKSIFIFNTSSTLNYPMGSHNNFANFINGSPPFNLPGYMNLVDYYLVLPKRYLSEHFSSALKLNEESIYYRSILKAPTVSLPMFRDCISENSPMMVFAFKESNIDTFESMSDPIMNTKNYLSTNGQQYSHSTFFDNFASKWIDTVSYDSLIHSLFCTTNNDSPEESYCLKIKDSKLLHLFPAFFDASKLMHTDITKRDQEETDKSDDVQIEAQALRQLHDKLYNAAERFNDVTYELATDPKPVIEKADEKTDQMYYDFRNKLTDKKDDYIERVEDKADRISEKLSSAENKIKSYKFSPHLFLKEEYEESSANGRLRDNDDEPDGDKSRYSILDNSLISKRSYITEEKEGLESESPIGGFALPLSLIRSAEYIVKSPRSKEFSQVIFHSADDQSSDVSQDSNNNSGLRNGTVNGVQISAPGDSQVDIITKFDGNEENEMVKSHHPSTNDDGENVAPEVKLEKRFSIFSSDDNCEKITWFNIFHHSIFGYPKFCTNKT